MKTFVYAMLFLLAAPAAWSGNENSGGGSGDAAEFTDLGYSGADLARALSSFPVTREAFREAVRTTHLEFVDATLRDANGLEVDARNYPEKRLIQVNLARWRKTFSFPEKRLRLAAHEYLSILGVDDHDYRNSGLLLDGGLVVSTMICTTWLNELTKLKGTLRWYRLDNSYDDGFPPRAKSDFLVEIQNDPHSTPDVGPVLINMSNRNGENGSVFTWNEAGAQGTAFFPHASLMTPGKFRVNIYLHDGFDGKTGLPNFQQGGAFDCSLSKGRAQ